MCSEHTAAREIIWLRSEGKGERQHVKQHGYCGKCGLVRVDGEDHGRPVEYFIDLLDRVQKHLDAAPWLGIRPFTEVEKRLLVQRMCGDELFNDPWGSYASRQLESFIKLLCNQRKHLTASMLYDILPG